MKLTLKKVILYCSMLIGIMFLAGCDEGNNAEEEMPDYWLTDQYNACVMVYNGDGIDIPKSIRYTEITEISEESLQVDNTCSYGCVVIVDVEGTCKITKEQLQYLKDFSERERYDVKYFGTKLMDLFVELKYMKEAYDTDAGVFYNTSDRGVKEYNAAGNPYASHGNWTISDIEDYKEDRNVLPKRIAAEIEFSARSAEKYRESLVD